MGVHQPAVSRWETGRRPEVQYFDALAEYLELDRDEVVRLAHTPAEDDGFDDLVAAMGERWADLPSEDQRRLAKRIRQLLEQ